MALWEFYQTVSMAMNRSTFSHGPTRFQTRGGVWALAAHLSTTLPLTPQTPRWRGTLRMTHSRSTPLGQSRRTRSSTTPTRAWSGESASCLSTTCWKRSILVKMLREVSPPLQDHQLSTAWCGKEWWSSNSSSQRRASQRCRWWNQSKPLVTSIKLLLPSPLSEPWLPQLNLSER